MPDSRRLRDLLQRVRRKHRISRNDHASPLPRRVANRLGGELFARAENGRCSDVYRQ